MLSNNDKKTGQEHKRADVTTMEVGTCPRSRFSWKSVSSRAIVYLKLELRSSHPRLKSSEIPENLIVLSIGGACNRTNFQCALSLQSLMLALGQYQGQEVLVRCLHHGGQHPRKI